MVTLERPATATDRVVAVIDTVSTWTGRAIGWLIIPMTFALVYEVFARHLLSSPTVWAYDVTFMLYGTHFMLGAAYTLRKGGHIRTDLIWQALSPRLQGLIDAIFYLLFFFPAIGLFLRASLDFAAVSWLRQERIVTSPWMPPIYPFKTVLPLTAILLLLQGFSEFLKSLYSVRWGKSYES